MAKRKFATGVVHDVPADLRKAIGADSKALAAWDDITPLARNEWICWVESAKKAETRARRIEWARENLTEGKRWPCCWPGCQHRKTKPSGKLESRALKKRGQLEAVSKDF